MTISRLCSIAYLVVVLQACGAPTDPAGREPVMLTERGCFPSRDGVSQYCAARFSADSSSIVFLRDVEWNRLSITGELAVYSVEEESVTPIVTNADPSFVVSDDGMWIATGAASVPEHDLAGDLRLFRRSAAGVELIAERAGIYPTRLALIDQPAEPSVLYIAQRGGTKDYANELGALPANGPGWQLGVARATDLRPMGASRAATITRYEFGKGGQVAVVDTTTGEQTLLPEYARIRPLSWLGSSDVTSDGELLAYYGGDGPEQGLWVYDSVSGAVELVGVYQIAGFVPGTHRLIAVDAATNDLVIWDRTATSPIKTIEDIGHFAIRPDCIPVVTASGALEVYTTGGAHSRTVAPSVTDAVAFDERCETGLYLSDGLYAWGATGAPSLIATGRVAIRGAVVPLGIGLVLVDVRIQDGIEVGTLASATLAGEITTIHSDVTAVGVATDNGARIWFRTLSGGYGVYDLVEQRLRYEPTEIEGPVILAPDGRSLVMANGPRTDEQLALYVLHL